MTDIGDYLRHLREKKSYTIAQLATYLRIPPNGFMQLERGSVLPTKYQLLQLAPLLGVRETVLLHCFQRQLVRLESMKQSKEHDRYKNMLRELEGLATTTSQIKVYRPDLPLANYIESITLQSGDGPGKRHEWVLPDGLSRLVINLTGQQQNDQVFHPSFKPAVLFGIQEKTIVLPAPATYRRLTIRFHPMGLYSLTGIPQRSLCNRVVDANDFFSPALSSLLQQLEETDDLTATIPIVVAFFTDLVKKQKVKQVERAVMQFVVENIHSTIDTLVHKSGYSQKHLIDLFKRHVGITPKKYQQVCRFSSVMEKMQLADLSTGLREFVCDNNYFDEAHFIKDFEHFTGITPTSFLKSGNTCARFVLIPDR